MIIDAMANKGVRPFEYAEDNPADDCYNTSSFYFMFDCSTTSYHHFIYRSYTHSIGKGIPAWL